MNLKIFTQNIEDEALKQINTLLAQDAFKDSKVRIMPDVHAGAGCVIGFTGDLGDKVIPNIVGVDIGCGVFVAELGNIDLDLEALDKFIKENIPAGREVHEVEDLYYSKLLISNLHCKDKLKNLSWLYSSLGTLGGGNHFIEIDIDSQGNKYLIIHTGSRNLGKQVADIYQNIAIEKLHSVPKQMKLDLIESLKSQGREKEINTELLKLQETYGEQIKLPKDLCYLEGEDRDKYLQDMQLCQQFARSNRFKIAENILSFIYGGWNTYTLVDVNTVDLEAARKANVSETVPFFESVHNYIDEDNMVRKGAISAYKGEKLIIPLNMRDGCIIGIGKGNEDWNYSAPHGAGRLMSRMEARRTLSLDDFKKVMSGIYTTTVDESTLDEAPMVYKNAEEIINAISDTVSIIDITKPIYNFKAAD